MAAVVVGTAVVVMLVSSVWWQPVQVAYKISVVFVGWLVA